MCPWKAERGGGFPLGNGGVPFIRPKEFDRVSIIDQAGLHIYQQLSQFFNAVRNKTQTPGDVYDSVALSVTNRLSEKSITDEGW